MADITIPPEVVRAVREAVKAKYGGWFKTEDAEAFFRAGLAAWPRSRQDYDLGEWSLILPLPQEKQT